MTEFTKDIPTKMLSKAKDIVKKLKAFKVEIDKDVIEIVERIEAVNRN